MVHRLAAREVRGASAARRSGARALGFRARAHEPLQTEPLAGALEADHPALAARLHAACGLRVVKRGKSKYYGDALMNFERARDCYLRAGCRRRGRRSSTTCAPPTHERPASCRASVSSLPVRSQPLSFRSLRARARSMDLASAESAHLGKSGANRMRHHPGHWPPAGTLRMVSSRAARRPATSSCDFKSPWAPRSTAHHPSRASPGITERNITPAGG